jgi:hypothetical protein
VRFIISHDEPTTSRDLETDSLESYTAPGNFSDLAGREARSASFDDDALPIRDGDLHFSATKTA